MALLGLLDEDEAEDRLQHLPVALQERLTMMSGATYLPDIPAPLTVLLRDREDPVIPVSDSRRLRDALGGRAGVHYTEFTAFRASLARPYDEVIFAFDVAFNPLFLVYVALLSLSFWSLVVMLTRLDVDALRSRVSLETPIRAVSIYLLVVAALFFLVWMKGIIPAIFSNTVPSDIVKAKIPTNPIYVLDLGFLLPTLVLAAIWLRRRRAWGYALAGPLREVQSILGLTIIASAPFPYWDGQSVSLGIVPLFVILTVGAALAVRYLGSLREASP